MISTAEGSIFVGNTGYFVKAHGLIATGCILYYAWTKRLWVLLLASAPWIVGRLYSGWSRGALLVLLISCCAIFLCQKRKEQRYQFPTSKYSFQLGVTVVLVLAFLSLFPVIRYDRTFFQKGGDQRINWRPGTRRLMNGQILGLLPMTWQVLATPCIFWNESRKRSDISMVPDISSNIWSCPFRGCSGQKNL